MSAGVSRLKKSEPDNVYPIRPVQTAMFGDVANDAPAPRVRGERHLLKFGVRADYKRDDGDVPLVKAVQLGLGDADVDREQLARDVDHGEPLSEREILRILDGTDQSGHRRAKLNAEVEECVEAFFHGAQATLGFDQAVIHLFHVLSHDLGYLKTAPDWILRLFVDEKAALIEVFTGHRDDRRIEVGDSDDGDEQ